MVRSFGDPVAVPVDTETTLAVVVPTGDGGSIFLEGIIQFNTPVAGSITDPVNGAIEIILRCYEGTDNTGLQIGSSWELSLDSALAAAIFNMSGAWSDSAITGAQPYAMTVQYAALGTDDGTASLSMLEAWVPGA